MTCPRCRQDELEKVRVTRFALALAKCPECDAVWPVDGPKSSANFVQFQLFLDLVGETEMTVDYEVLGML